MAMPGALSDLRVVDFTRIYAGPFASMMLADMGAQVIKIESDEGDAMRYLAPYAGRIEGPERGGYFYAFNRNKLSVTLNLKDPRGRDLVLRLIAMSDVVIENFSPGVMKRLGLDWPAVHAVNPRAVMCSISGFGQEGPYSSRLSYDGVAQAMGGLAFLNGEKEGAPLRVGPSIGDLSASLYAVVGILTALHAREKTGRGQMVDIAQQDCIFSILEDAIPFYTMYGEIRSRTGSCHPTIEPYDMFQCRDGWVFFSGYSDQHWERVCRQFGRLDLVTDERTRDTKARGVNYENFVRSLLAEWLAPYSRAELTRIFDELRVPFGPVLDVRECVEDPNLRARGMVVEIDHPVGGNFLFAGNPVRLSETPWRLHKAAPLYGDGNKEVLCGLLGLTEDELARLQRAGVVYEEPVGRGKGLRRGEATNRITTSQGEEAS